jgi:hypothetical protein
MIGGHDLVCARRRYSEQLHSAGPARAGCGAVFAVQLRSLT